MDKVGILFLYILLAVMRLTFAETNTKSALIHDISTLQEGHFPPKSIIECAFRMLKKTITGARMAEKTGICEGVSGSNLLPSEHMPGFRYLKMPADFTQSINSGIVNHEKVRHFLFSEVVVGDRFRFVIQKGDNDKFAISFKHTGSDKMLIFDALSDRLKLNDKYERTLGEKEQPPYPFTDVKEYCILFEILETHWMIYIDDVAFTTFDHRQSISRIEWIVVTTDHMDMYRSKILQPRI